MAPKRSRSRDSEKVSASPKPQRRRADRPRPSAEWVEIPPDELEPAKAPRLRGVLRGLDPKAVLTPPATKGAKTASFDDDDEELPGLRSSLREGRNTVAIYSAKYHPMDDVTRPKRAERITGRRARVDLSDDESNGTEPNLGNDDDSDVTIDDDDSGMRVGATQHSPDPGATRHSKRSEARKAVIYNAKCHPQDYALPGFRTRRLARQGATRPRSSKRSAREDEVDDVSDGHGAEVETVEISSSVEESESDAEGDQIDRPEIGNSDASQTLSASPGRSPAVPRRSYRNALPGEPRRPRLQNAASDVDAIHIGQYLTGHGYHGQDDDPLQLFAEAESPKSSRTISKAIRGAEEYLSQTIAPYGPDDPAASSEVQPSKPAALAIVRPYSTQRPATQLPADPPTRDSALESSHSPNRSPAPQRSIFRSISAPAKTSSPVRPNVPNDHDETTVPAGIDTAITDTAILSLLNTTGAVETSSNVPQTTASKANRASSAAIRTSCTIHNSKIYNSAHSRVASSTTIRRSTDGSIGSREEMPPSSHFEDAFVPDIPPGITGGYTLSQLEKPDSTTGDSLDDLTEYCNVNGIPTSAQVPIDDPRPTTSNQRPALQPIDGNISCPRSIFGPYNDETMAQPAVLKQS
ncbi:hypothetical protein B0A48_16346 [Cryoendolithus antarcticus]|uniref:Uncharacterized protein n=1 Tax=Cryoendolithus antarcticus TaxID=1507870 RepID=A0A1V8SDQ5_9PEZI|nr:hypothetical protein B0A48_16346 [Cryoendolithus antarcticus]